MWDLSSPTRAQTLIPWIGRWILTPGPPRKSLFGISEALVPFSSMLHSVLIHFKRSVSFLWELSRSSLCLQCPEISFWCGSIFNHYAEQWVGPSNQKNQKQKTKLVLSSGRFFVIIWYFLPSFFWGGGTLIVQILHLLGGSLVFWTFPTLLVRILSVLFYFYFSRVLLYLLLVTF